MSGRQSQQGGVFRGAQTPSGTGPAGRATPSRGATAFNRHGTASPAGPGPDHGGGRPRKVSGSSSRTSPGPGQSSSNIYRTMPLSGQLGGGRITPSNLVRPIPQHMLMGTPGPGQQPPGSSLGGATFSPINVPKMTSQSPV